LAVAVLLTAGCGMKFEKPPIECSFRPSLVGAGKILRLENRSDEPLRAVAVTIRTKKGKVTHSGAEIGAHQVLEVGWKKLGGFEISDDAEIEIRAKGYLLPLRVELADSDETQESERE
jgi:hypothetical protein